MNKRYTFCIAEHLIDVVFAGQVTDDISMLPSFAPFLVRKADDGSRVFSNGSVCAATAGPIFTLTVDSGTKPAGKADCKRIDSFDTGNGPTVVDAINGGGYQFAIKDIRERCCCLMLADSDFTDIRCALNGSAEMRHFGLNNALMMAYAFRGSFFKTLLIHASLVRNRGYGYAFIAKSGTGKSTHTSLWLKHIEGSDLMNDDNPIVRVTGGRAFVYGSPWSGKTPCYRNAKAPLGAITKIDRAPANSIEKLKPVAAFAEILASCSSMKWDKTIYRNTYDTVISLVETVPSANILHCRPDEEAARLCHKAIAIN